MENVSNVNKYIGLYVSASNQFQWRHNLIEDDHQKSSTCMMTSFNSNIPHNQSINQSFIWVRRHGPHSVPSNSIPRNQFCIGRFHCLALFLVHSMVMPWSLVFHAQPRCDAVRGSGRLGLVGTRDTLTQLAHVPCSLMSGSLVTARDGLVRLLRFCKHDISQFA